MIQGQADLIDPEQSAADAGTGAGDPDVIAEKAEEALMRIKTTHAVTDTLVGDPDLTPVDLVTVTTELATHIEASFDVSVRTDLPEQAFVTANAGLRSVVDNLLENAVEHNDPDDPQITVAVDIDSDADMVQLTVRDNGPGIPDEQKQQLFDTQGIEIGRGGVALIQTLVDGYGGSVHVEDNEPRGSVFIVELPHADSNL